MVRRKVEIKKIEDKAKRHTTFTKRRQGLFKKAKDLSERSGDEIAIVTFSLAGNVYAFGSPSVDSVVRRYEATARDSHEPPLSPGEEDFDDDDDDEEDEIEFVKEEDICGAVVAPEDKAARDLEVLNELEAVVEAMKKEIRDLANQLAKNQL